MEEPNEKIVDLIQKLLALSHSSNEHEAALALSKAQDLLEKYNLDLESVRHTDNKASPLINAPVPGDQEWRIALITAIAHASFCKTVKEWNSLHILGRHPNVMSTIVMAGWVIVQLEPLAWKAAANNGRRGRKDGYVNSFLIGATQTIRKRLEQERLNRECQNKNLSALVITLDQEADKFMHEQYPNLRNGRGSGSRLDSEAYWKGKDAGNKVSLTVNNQVSKTGPLMLNGG